MYNIIEREIKIIMNLFEITTPHGPEYTNDEKYAKRRVRKIKQQEHKKCTDKHLLRDCFDKDLYYYEVVPPWQYDSNVPRPKDWDKI